MLSIRFPQVHKHISKNFHGGLLPLKFKEDLKIRLIVKATKEMLLSAKIRKFFNIYVIPISQDGVNGFSLISAFYDGDIDPLTITTPLFSEPQTEFYREMLLGEEVEIHFFDENNVEFLGYRSKIECPKAARELITTAEFPSFTTNSAKNVIEQMEDWYLSERSKNDESCIKILLIEPLFPDDFVIIDARPSKNIYTSVDQIHGNILERIEPGDYQERDIAQVFSRIFKSHQIYLNPFDPISNEEICDLLIVGENHILFVQAKDSPNVEKILQNSISRKKSTAKKHLEKALRQIEGAIKYSKKEKKMDFLIGERKFSVNIKNQKICGLVVMKEFFFEDYPDYTSSTMKVCDQLESPVILLDYNELHSYTMNLTNEKYFFLAFDKVFLVGKESNVFPRLRFGFI